MRSIELRQKILLIKVGWTTLVIKWESDERKKVFLSKLLRIILSGISLANYINSSTDTYAQLSLQELKDRLNENINSIYVMIDSLVRKNYLNHI